MHLIDKNLSLLNEHFMYVNNIGAEKFPITSLPVSRLEDKVLLRRAQDALAQSAVQIS